MHSGAGTRQILQPPLRYDRTCLQAQTTCMHMSALLRHEVNVRWQGHQMQDERKQYHMQRKNFMVVMLVEDNLQQPESCPGLSRPS